MGRAPCCDKANVKKGPWSPEEDVKLKAYIEEHGTGGNWIALPRKIGIKRCGKSCRLRWLNYLRPNIKHGGFSEEEDNIICSLYISIGSRWSIIAAQLPGRTDNDVKNYWNTRLKKKLLLGIRKDSQSQMRERSNSKEEKDGGLNASAIERMQLHMQLQGLNNNTCFSFYNNRPELSIIGDQYKIHLQTDQQSRCHDQMEVNNIPQFQKFPLMISSTPEPSPNTMSLPTNHHDHKVSITCDFDNNSLHGFSSESSYQAFNIEKTAGLHDDLSELIFGPSSSNSNNNNNGCLEVHEGKQELINQDLDWYKNGIPWWSSPDLQPESFCVDYTLGTTYI